MSHSLVHAGPKKVIKGIIILHWTSCFGGPTVFYRVFTFNKGLGNYCTVVGARLAGLTCALWEYHHEALEHIS